MLESVIPRILGQMPVSWRRAIIGRPDNPSRLATWVHDLLNRLPQDNAQEFDCQGALKGYRMCIDWSRFRSFVYGTWEPEVVDAIRTTVKPGMTVFDIGAHIGYYSLLCAKCVEQTGRVIAFEPLPENFSLLEKNVALNKLSRVLTVRKAVFSENREVVITVPDQLPNSGDASLFRQDGTRQLHVAATTLDTFCRDSNVRPDVLKMDVEGAERDVLMGARDTIGRHHPTMLIELHHFDGNLAGHPVPDLLGEWGYEIRWIERSLMTSHILASPGAGASTDKRTSLSSLA